MKQVLLTEHPHLYSVRHTSDTRESVSEFAQAHIAGKHTALAFWSQYLCFQPLNSTGKLYS